MKKSILFICSGNMFRSISAELLFKKYLKDNNLFGWKVSSAEFSGKKREIHKKVIETLNNLGIKKIQCKQRKLTDKMLEEFDIIIEIGDNHHNSITSKLTHKNILLFNELAIGKKNSIQDVDLNTKNKKVIQEKIEKIIKEIHKFIPRLYNEVNNKFYLFSDFISGLRKHRNGFPFIKLYETKNTVSFMSIDIPENHEGHVLVVPKKRYSDLSEIPENVLNELIKSIKKVGNAFRKNNFDYNVLLNNGTDAGQCIFHTHFHIIPRKKKDGIKIELWNKKEISVKSFVKLNNKLKKIINN